MGSMVFDFKLSVGMYNQCIITLTAGFFCAVAVPQGFGFRGFTSHINDLHAIHQYHNRRNLPLNYYTWNNVLYDLDELEDNLEDASDNYRYQRQHANAWYLDRRLNDFDHLEDHLEYSLGYDRKKRSANYVDNLHAIHQYHNRRNLPLNYYTWSNVLYNLDELEDNLEDASDNYRYQRQHSNAWYLDRRLNDFDHLED